MDLGKQGETRRKAVKVKEALSFLSDVSITVFNVQLLSVKKKRQKMVTSHSAPLQFVFTAYVQQVYKMSPQFGVPNTKYTLTE